MVRQQLIKLNYNENPVGASPLAIKAAKKALKNCHRYPDSKGLSLKICLSKHYGIRPENITLGNGSESLLELITKTYLSPLHSAVVPNYSFNGLSKIIKNSGAYLKIAKNTFLSITASSLLAAVGPETKIVFVVNPNNPTGSYINHYELVFLLNKLPKDTLVVIDEAYAEYVEENTFPNTLNLLSTYQNLIITKTFSKFYGLAGLRLGYVISNPTIAASLNTYSLEFNVNSIALAAAEASLKDKHHIELSRLTNRLGLAHLSQGLKDLGLEIIPSYSNFICFNLKSSCHSVYERLLGYNVLVRSLYDYGLPYYLRISIGTKTQNQYFLKVLKKILLAVDKNS